MKKYAAQIQLIGLWVIAISLAVIATRQVIDIYHRYKEQQEDTLLSAPPPFPNSTATKPTGPITKVEYADTLHDFGTITEGDSVSYTYKFKNVGNKPLTILNAYGSCGCTVPYWPKKPVAAGDGGEIKVVFHSKGKQGFQAKNVTVMANTNPDKTMLRFKVNVEPAKKTK